MLVYVFCYKEKGKNQPSKAHKVRIEGMNEAEKNYYLKQVRDFLTSLEYYITAEAEVNNQFFR